MINSKFKRTIIICFSILIFNSNINAMYDNKKREKRKNLQIACETGKLEVIKNLVKNGFNIRGLFLKHISLLDIAIINNQAKVAKYLLSMDIHIRGNEDQYLIHACKNLNYEIIKLLVQEYQANVNAKNIFNKNKTPIYYIIKQLTDPYYKTISGRFNFSLNSEQLNKIQKNYKTSKRIIRFLIKNGANIKVNDLFYPCKKGCIKTFKFLEEFNVNLMGKFKSGLSLLDMAFMYEKYDLVEYLIKKNTPIHNYKKAYLLLACKNGKIEIVKFLEKFNIDLTAKQLLNRSVLDITFIYKHENLAEYLITKNIPLYGNKEDYLFFACKINNLKLVKYLIENGANSKARNTNGLSPFEVTKDTEIQKYLINNNTTIYGDPDNYMETACKEGSINITKFLVNNGANVKNENFINTALDNDHNLLADYLIKENTQHTNAQKTIKNNLKILNSYEKTANKIYENFQKAENIILSEACPFCVIKEKVSKATILNNDCFKLIIQLLKTNNDKIIIEFNNSDMPTYTRQKIIKGLTEIYKKRPKTIEKKDLKKMYKKIIYNANFINNDKFKNARIFATKNSIRDIDNMPIEKACLLRSNQSLPMRQILPHVFSHKGDWYNSSKEQLMKFIEDNNYQNNNLLKMLASAKKINKKMYQTLLCTTYVNCLLGSNELSNNVVSCLDGESLKEIVDKI